MEPTILSEQLIITPIVAVSGLIGILIGQFIEFVKLKFEQKYEHQTFLRQKYEELVFRLIDFSISVKKAELKPFQGEHGEGLSFSEFAKQGGQIEVLTVLYFPK